MTLVWPSRSPRNFPPHLIIHMAASPWFQFTDPRRARTIALVLTLMFGGGSAARAQEILIERTLLPDAAPSSFAIGLPNGVNFCYDVVRGGVSYIWQGGFVDVTSVRPNAGKAISPVKLLGEIMYREDSYFPLRRGDPQRSAAFQYKGYRLKADAIEFLYEIDQCRVSEEVRSAPDGDGLVRRFRIEGAPPHESWWYIPGHTHGGKLTAPEAHRESNGFRFNTTQGLALEVRFEKASS